MKLKSRVVSSLKREEAICDLAIERLLGSIREHEKKHRLTTEKFLEKFESGELGDDAEYFEWYALAEAIRDWQETKKELKEAVG